MNNAIILAVFGVIVLILGAYTLYTAGQMKKTQEPPSWLLTEEDIAQIKRPVEFCSDIRPGTILLGLTCVFYGIYDLLEYIFIQRYIAKVLGVDVLLTIVLIYFISLRRKKERYKN